MTLTSERYSQSATIMLNGSSETVFPLFGPVKEKEWAMGWDPEIIFGDPNSIEEHMIFQTRDQHDQGKYLWTISRFQPDELFIEYMVTSTERLWFIRVQCKDAGEKTIANITYTFTGLTTAGNELNKKALAAMYSRDLKDWEESINYYLKTGKKL